jgi:probable HAF family extracellular repeat protein
MCYTQSRFKALISACVLSLIATAGWSQSITWLGTLPGGGRSEAYGVSADGAVVVGWSYNAAGQYRAFRWTASGGMQDLGTLGDTIGAGLMVFPPMAPWWSASLTTLAGLGACLSLDGFWWDAGPRHAGRLVEPCFCCFSRWLRGGRRGLQRRRGSFVPFAGRRSGGMQDVGTLAGIRL